MSTREYVFVLTDANTRTWRRDKGGGGADNNVLEAYTRDVLNEYDKLLLGFAEDNECCIGSIMRELHAVGRGDLCTRWSYSIVDLADLAVVTTPPTPACQDTQGALSLGSLLPQTSCVRCTASQRRAGRDSVLARLKNVLGLRCHVSFRLLSFSVPPRVYNKSGLRLALHDNRHCPLGPYMLRQSPSYPISYLYLFLS